MSFEEGAGIQGRGLRPRRQAQALAPARGSVRRQWASCRLPGHCQGFHQSLGEFVLLPCGQPRPPASEQRPCSARGMEGPSCCASAQDTSDVSAASAPAPLDTSPSSHAPPGHVSAAPSPLAPIATSSGRETAHLMAEAQTRETARASWRGLQHRRAPGGRGHTSTSSNLAEEDQQWELMESTFEGMMRRPWRARGPSPDSCTFSTLISSSIRCVLFLDYC